jgi:hypothetical protein
VGGDRDFDQVVLAQRFEFVEESTAPPVEFVGDDPIELDRIENRDCADQVRSDLWFGAELDSWGHMGRVPSLLALLRLRAPVLGQKQLMRQKGHSPGSDRCEKDADLAVVFLAQATVVLTGDSCALIAFLGKGTLVDNANDSDRAACCGGHQLVGEDMLKVGLDIFVIPGAAVDELLHCGDIALAHVQSDRLDTFALGTDHQSLDVGEGIVLSLVLAEAGGKPLVELDQAFGRCAHVVFGHGSSLPTEPRIDDELASSSMLCSQPTQTP